MHVYIASHAVTAISSAANSGLNQTFLELYLAMQTQLQMHMCEDLRVALLVDTNAALL